MQKVLTAAQMREVDHLTTERYGIPSLLLMENAAHAVARVITEKLGGSVEGKSILILCGKGNNGGDGAAVGRILQLSGADVEVVLFGKIAQLSGDAETNLTVARTIVGSLQEIDSAEEWSEWFNGAEKRWDVTVDAIFGSGLSRPISGWLESAVKEILNENSTRQFSGRLRVAVDLPSGVISDCAHAPGEVLESDLTVTFTAPKPANVLASSYSLGGELIVADIGSPAELVEEAGSELFVATRRDAELWLSRTDFAFGSFKSRRGHALVIAGSEDYSGAAVLAGNATIRSGVGLATLATPSSIKESVAARSLPEVIVRPISEAANGGVAAEAFGDMGEMLEVADAIAVGCGLSANDPGVETLVREIVDKRTKPVIVDAGALWFYSPMSPDISGSTDISRADRSVRPHIIFTPHEGEFMRLLGTRDKEAIKDRVAAVREFATQHNVILVLKGERVLIGEPGGKVVVNPTGNSGLGKAGNGDTLTGIMVGFVAQAVQMKVDIFETVVAAVYVAGMAGDIAEKKYGKRVMTASDVRECLSEAFVTLSEPPA